MKYRKYKTRRNAEKRMKILQRLYPERHFWIAPDYWFMFVVFTEENGRYAACN